jgi:hypothetical protein
MHLVQLTVTDTTGILFDHYLMRTWIREHDIYKIKWPGVFWDNHYFGGGRHDVSPLISFQRQTDLLPMIV